MVNSAKPAFSVKQLPALHVTSWKFKTRMFSYCETTLWSKSTQKNSQSVPYTTAHDMRHIICYCSYP